VTEKKKKRARRAQSTGMTEVSLLYLLTQIRFPIGGERVKCRGSKLTYFPRRTKLTNSLGKQRLGLSTRT